MKTLEERYKGSDTDAWKNSPIYMTGPAVLTYTVQQYLKLKVPVSGFLGTTYSVSLAPLFCCVIMACNSREPDVHHRAQVTAFGQGANQSSKGVSCRMNFLAASETCSKAWLHR